MISKNSPPAVDNQAEINKPTACPDGSYGTISGCYAKTFSKKGK